MRSGMIIVVGLIVTSILSIFLIIEHVEQLDVSMPEKQKPEDLFKDWNRSGLFAIDKHEYKIGENIFIIAENLRQVDKGNMIFILPNGTTIYTKISFDGAVKSEFNKYFTPQISKMRKICDTNELIGQWMILLNGTDFEPILFRILNETSTGQVGTFEKIC